MVLELLLVPLFGPDVVRIVAHEIVVGVDAVLQAAGFRLAIRRLTQLLASPRELGLLLHSACCVYMRRLPPALRSFDGTLSNLRPSPGLELLGGCVTVLGALEALLVDRRIPIPVKVLEKQVWGIILSQ